MCKYWATRFPCGCFSHRCSGYEFCQNRGGEGCKVLLERWTWKTLCHRGREGLRGRKYTAAARLPRCCDGLDAGARKALCRKCDASPRDPLDSPIQWHCPEHLELTKTELVKDRADAERFFERAVAQWPIDHQGRYFRRKADKACKGYWWSC
ncbi:hypothetical protein F4802DRAFT_602708 [Xylaria palmicola]|nr:hypothetical protein F4802DRAFT_602708 [Xylaria palmicola]